ncbi:MAG TPA: exodeoxyribonuclease VII small subunit [candidate division Zixibacteria bacterium]|jgi:exodeoxyribonuclease VII small subunit|nr:exodeoxyribonuclease VII small subunit [candidate division Zixibacteria bacterium]
MAKARKDAGFKFEKALERIERIVERLESGEAELEQALSLHQEASELMARCRQALDETQKKIKKLVRDERGHRTQDMDLEEPNR